MVAYENIIVMVAFDNTIAIVHNLSCNLYDLMAKMPLGLISHRCPHVGMGRKKSNRRYLAPLGSNTCRAHAILQSLSCAHWRVVPAVCFCARLCLESTAQGGMQRASVSGGMQHAGVQTGMQHVPGILETIMRDPATVFVLCCVA